MPNLEGMTQEKWSALTTKQRMEMREPNWTPQLVGLEGCRVEVVDRYGEKRRFWVGRSTGWKPIHLEIKTKRSAGGFPADLEYVSVRVIRGRA